MKPDAGFTLIELIITVTVAAVLLGLAVPSFQTMMQNNRLVSQANEFITTLNLARSEAVKRGTRVTVCASSGGTACDGGGTGIWTTGWIVFTDPNNVGVYDAASETILQVHGALFTGYTLTAGATLTNFVSYLGTGLSQGAGGATPDGTATSTFALADPRGTDTSGNSLQRTMAMNATGQITTNHASFF